MNKNICTCGNNVGENGNKALHNDNLETSFVHLPSHLPFAHLGENAPMGKNSTVLSEGGMLDSHRYINKMWKITEAQLHDEGSRASIDELEKIENLCLCSSCIERCVYICTDGSLLLFLYDLFSLSCFHQNFICNQ